MAKLTEKQGSVFLSVGLILIAFLLHTSSICYIKTKVENKIDNIRTIDVTFQNTLDTAVVGSKLNLVGLTNQLKATQKIKNYYLDIGVVFYRNYYAFSICAILFGTFLAIASFLLIGYGWKPSPLIVKTFFLTNVLISSFYFFLPTVLNNRENYAANLKKVKTFNQIQTNILAYAAKLSTKKYLNNPDSLSAFLNKSYEDIANNFDLETVEIHTERLGDNPQDILKSATP